MARKYQIVDRHGVEVTADKTKKYIRRRDGSTAIATTEQTTTAAADELTFSGSKSDIRKGEMGERNVSVLHNLVLDVEDKVTANAAQADANLSLAYTKVDVEQAARLTSEQGIKASIAAIETNAATTTAALGDAFPSTGGVLAGHVIPETDIMYDLGSPNKRWKDVYIGPGSLYIGGQKVLESDADTIVITADRDQNISMRAKGYGDLELTTERGAVQIKSDVLMAQATGFNTTDSSPIPFHSGISVQGEKITNVAMATELTDAANKSYVDLAISGVSSAAEIDNAIALSEAATLAQISLVNSLVSSNDLDIASLQTKTAINDSDINNLRVDVTGLTSGAASTLTLVNTAKSDITSIESNVNTVEAVIASHTSSLSSVDNSLNILTSADSDLLNKANKASTDIIGLQSSTDTLNAASSKAASDISALNNSVNTNAQGVASNAAANTANANSIVGHDGEIAANASNISSQAATLADHEAQLSSIANNTADADSITSLNLALTADINAETASRVSEDAALNLRIDGTNKMSSGASTPYGPQAGDTWYNTANSIIYISVFDGDTLQWIDIS